MEPVQFEVFRSGSQRWIPVEQVDQAQMREVDRIATEDFHLGILQMMENAGRNLAVQAFRLHEKIGSANQPFRVLVAAGSGGNGGGGICAARHLHNHGAYVSLLLTSRPGTTGSAVETQLNILHSAGISPLEFEEATQKLHSVDLVLDAIIGYSLKGAPRGLAKQTIERINVSGVPVISLDLPSGVDASCGDTPGVYVQASQTLTLALPKPGLRHPASGELFLADIGIPPEVYLPLGMKAKLFAHGENILPLRWTNINL